MGFGTATGVSFGVKHNTAMARYVGVLQKRIRPVFDAGLGRASNSIAIERWFVAAPVQVGTGTVVTYELLANTTFVRMVS